uniref:Uncharacterized protein n=1 Tax=Romanomermis culicivorax TaxID=13658 RepID=A0A915JHD0_ROMCU
MGILTTRNFKKNSQDSTILTYWANIKYGLSWEDQDYKRTLNLWSYEKFIGEDSNMISPPRRKVSWKKYCQKNKQMNKKIKE